MEEGLLVYSGKIALMIPARPYGESKHRPADPENEGGKRGTGGLQTGKPPQPLQQTPRRGRGSRCYTINSYLDSSDLLNIVRFLEQQPFSAEQEQAFRFN